METAEINPDTEDKTLRREELRFQRQKERVRKRLLKYTRKAFRLLPKLDSPRILDVCCGSGVPTMELARLSNGEIIGLDIDQFALDMLTEKIRQAGLSDRVKTMNHSVLNMEFEKESFDIIWSEGCIHVVGFKKGLREWRRVLKPNGYMVVHDGQDNIDEKLEQISSCGYKLLGHFLLSEDTWWAEYFIPLEKLVAETLAKYGDNPKVHEAIDSSQREIDMFRNDPERNSSVFFIMRRADGD
jgi:ubiquinone/menaquinone biosynthesis C-methylase UbiE